MPVFLLDREEKNIFPHPELADESGIIAVGGDLSPERLITAYSFGIFPWYNEEDPIIWWSPDPRAIIVPGQVKVNKSMRPYMRKFSLSIDRVFGEVIKHCQEVPRNGIRESWITGEMMEAYIRLHEMGYAHSFETWFRGKLVGGLYGVSIGRCFFGESMFSLSNNASKYALVRLSEILSGKHFILIDCQVPNDHLMRMGCREVERSEYLRILRMNLLEAGFTGSWADWV